MKEFKYCVMCDSAHKWKESDLTQGQNHKQQLSKIVCNDCKIKLSEPTSTTDSLFFLQKAIRIVEGK